MNKDRVDTPLDQTGADPLAWLWRGKNAWFVVTGLWLMTVLLSVFLNLELIREPKYSDPDDAMRIVQVRDLLAGQSWFDVTQYRSFAPFGAEMHWSRLVDLPIAGMILLLRPLIGPEAAALATAVVIPVMAMGALFVALFWGMRGPFGVPHALVCCLILAFTPTVLHRLAPLRVDHHGWQIVLAAVVLGGIVHSDARRGGILAGLALAVSLRISSEGLPLAVITGAILTLRYVLLAAEWTRLSLYIGVLVVTSTGLLLLTEGLAAALKPHCDTFSIAYLAPIVALAFMLFTTQLLLGDKNRLRRAIPSILGLLTAASVFFAVGQPCLGGPFGSMDPIVRMFWYEKVAEGLPLWTQSAHSAGIVILSAIPGLIGLSLAVLVERDPTKRLNWLSLLIAAVGTFAVALLVFRAVSVAHLATVPGSGWLILACLRWIYGFGLPLLRICLTPCLIVLAPGGPTLGTTLVLGDSATTTGPKPMGLKRANFVALQQIEKSIIFAAIDISPEILLETGHSVVATGHHRNQAGLGMVIKAFTATPDAARKIIETTGADYVLLGKALSETRHYLEFAPDGLAARLAKGEVPNWLVQVELNGIGDMLLFRLSSS